MDARNSSPGMTTVLRVGRRARGHVVAVEMPHPQPLPTRGRGGAHACACCRRRQLLVYFVPMMEHSPAGAAAGEYADLGLPAEGHAHVGLGAERIGVDAESLSLPDEAERHAEIERVRDERECGENHRRRPSTPRRRHAGCRAPGWLRACRISRRSRSSKRASPAVENATPRPPRKRLSMWRSCRQKRALRRPRTRRGVGLICSWRGVSPDLLARARSLCCAGTWTVAGRIRVAAFHMYVADAKNGLRREC